MGRDALFKNLVEVHQVLDKHNIRHWLSHGTILGAYRDNNFIAWDDDADLGMDFSQRGDMGPVLAELADRGFYIPPCDPAKPISKDNAPYYDMVAIRDGEKIEGWFFEKFGDHYIYDKPRAGNSLKHHTKYYDELGTFNFRGVEFNIPNHIEDYLVMMYGETWRIPNPCKKYNHQS